MDILSIGSLLVIVIGILNFVYRFFIRRGPGKRIVIGILNFLRHFIRREHSNDKAGSGEESRIKILGITIDPRISIGSLLAIVFAIFTFCHTEFVGKVKNGKPLNKVENGKPLDIVPRPAQRTFLYPLGNSGLIENAGGEGTFTDKYNFAEGECGTSGFISKGPTDVVIFTLENEFTNLNGGTIEVCVTPHRDPKDAPHNFSLLRIPPHKKEAGVILKVVGIAKKAPAIRMRIVINPEIAEPVKSIGVLDWEVGKDYHIAGTWGPEGMYLYINGKKVGVNADFKESPKSLQGKLAINNDGLDDGPDDLFNNPTECVLSNLQISNYQKSAEEIEESYLKLHPDP